MRFLLKIALAILITITYSCESESNLDSVTNPEADVTFVDDNVLAAKGTTKQTVDIFDFVNGGVVGSSTLHRNSSGITVNFKTTALVPGHTYTLWWVIWNNPENCTVPGACTDADFALADAVEVEVMYAAGHVAGNNGSGNFSGHLNENDASGTINPLFGLASYGGLLDAGKAEVHAVLRSHGPRIPGLVAEQIGSYVGGCSINLPPFSGIPDEVGECGDIYAAIHQP